MSFIFVVLPNINGLVFIWHYHHCWSFAVCSFCPACWGWSWNSSISKVMPYLMTEKYHWNFAEISPEFVVFDKWDFLCACVHPCVIDRSSMNILFVWNSWLTTNLIQYNCSYNCHWILIFYIMMSLCNQAG